MKTSQLALAGIALLFVALRLPALSAPFTGDDLWVALSSESFAKSWKLEDLQVFMLGYDHQGTGFVDLYKWKDHPPGSFVPWAVFSLLPVPLETSMRLLVLLANLGTLAFTYLLAKKIASERTALFAAFLTAVSTYQVFHSSYLVEVTGSLVTLFTLASFYYLFKFIDSNSRKDFLPVVIASALSVFTYFLALIPLAFQCAVLALNGNRREALYLLLAPVTAMALFWAFVTYGLGSDYASGFLAYAFNPQSVTDAPTLYDSLYPKIVGAGLVATQLGTPLIALFLISAFNS
ncbi:MAG TPA: glycosyltransferase family 39 protein, partial [archaeon]|nr:glycosyltransferase family 39 protein [archaeon]